MSRPSFALSLRPVDDVGHLRHLGCFTAGAAVSRVDVDAAINAARVELDAALEQDAARRRGGRPVKVRASVPRARPAVTCIGYGEVTCTAERSDARHPRCRRCSRRAADLANAAKAQRRRKTPRTAVCACGATIVPHGTRGQLRHRCEPCREARHRETSRQTMRRFYAKQKRAA